MAGSFSLETPIALPVMGDGNYEWDGYLPIKEKPHIVNPSKGFFASTNQNVTPCILQTMECHWFLNGQILTEVIG